MACVPRAGVIGKTHPYQGVLLIVIVSSPSWKRPEAMDGRGFPTDGIFVVRHLGKISGHVIVGYAPATFIGRSPIFGGPRRTPPGLDVGRRGPAAAAGLGRYRPAAKVVPDHLLAVPPLRPQVPTAGRPGGRGRSKRRQATGWRTARLSRARAAATGWPLARK